MVIAYILNEVHLATLKTDETCPYCKHKHVFLDIGQLYVDVIFWLCMPSRRTGKAYCTHCGCEIPKKQWSAYLKGFFSKHKKQYKLSKWKRYSFLFFMLLPLALVLLWFIIIIIGA